MSSVIWSTVRPHDLFAVRGELRFVCVRERFARQPPLVAAIDVHHIDVASRGPLVLVPVTTDEDDPSTVGGEGGRSLGPRRVICDAGLVASVCVHYIDVRRGVVEA